MLLVFLASCLLASCYNFEWGNQGRAFVSKNRSKLTLHLFFTHHNWSAETVLDFPEFFFPKPCERTGMFVLRSCLKATVSVHFGDSSEWKWSPYFHLELPSKTLTLLKILRLTWWNCWADANASVSFPIFWSSSCLASKYQSLDISMIKNSPCQNKWCLQY